MNDKYWALFGVAGPLVAYFFIGISIASVPWFSLWNNALSDLGHAVHSGSAPYLNFGLLLAGSFIAVFTVTVFWKHEVHQPIPSDDSLRLAARIGLRRSLWTTTRNSFSHIFRFSDPVMPRLRCGKKVNSRSTVLHDRVKRVDTIWRKNPPSWNCSTRNNLSRRSNIMGHHFCPKNILQV